MLVYRCFSALLCPVSAVVEGYLSAKNIHNISTRYAGVKQSTRRIAVTRNAAAAAAPAPARPPTERTRQLLRNRQSRRYLAAGPVVLDAIDDILRGLVGLPAVEDTGTPIACTHKNGSGRGGEAASRPCVG